MEVQSRESDYMQNPDIGFIRECLMDLKKTGYCYAFEMWQVEEIQRIYKIKYNAETTYQLNNWYYTIRVCN